MTSAPAAAGGTQALYARLYRRLLLLVREPAEAHRLAEAVWTRIAAARTTESEDTAWLALLGNALPRALRQLRRAGRVARSRGEPTPPEGGAPEGLSEPQRAAWFALGALQPQPRIALLLTLFDGVEPDAAAALLGTTPATVEAWTALARQRLRSVASHLPVDDEPLRDALADLEQALPAPAVLPDPAALRRRRWFARSRWAVGLLAAAALVAVGIGLWTDAGPAARPSPSQTASGPVSVAWSVTPFTAPTAQIRSVSVIGNLLVLTGAQGDAPAAWISADGRTFTSAVVHYEGSPPGPIGVPASAGVGGVQSGQRLLALGPVQDDGTTLLWRSDDGGRSWVLSPVTQVPGRVSVLLGTRSGFVALGGPASAPFAWTSPDGIVNHWQPVTAPGPADARTLTAAATDGSRIVVGGSALGRSASASGSPAGIPALWISGDGAQTWQPAQLPVGGSGQVEAVAVDATGLAAVGFSDSPHLWQSADGTTWADEALPIGPGWVMPFVSGGPDGWVVDALAEDSTGGQSGTREALWFVPRDAASTATSTDPPLAGAHLAGIAWFRDRWVGAATCAPDLDCAGPVLISGRLSD